MYCLYGEIKIYITVPWGPIRAYPVCNVVDYFTILCHQIKNQKHVDVSPVVINGCVHNRCIPIRHE